MSEEKEDWLRRPWVLIAAVALAGPGATGLTLQTVPKKLTEADITEIAKRARPDPFTATEAHVMRAELIEAVTTRWQAERWKLVAEIRALIQESDKRQARALEVHMCQQLRALELRMPPEATRDRIDALEKSAQSTHGGYVRPTNRWTESVRECQSALVEGR